MRGYVEEFDIWGVKVGERPPWATTPRFIRTPPHAPTHVSLISHPWGGGNKHSKRTSHFSQYPNLPYCFGDIAQGDFFIATSIQPRYIHNSSIPSIDSFIQSIHPFVALHPPPNQTKPNHTSSLSVYKTYNITHRGGRKEKRKGRKGEKGVHIWVYIYFLFPPPPPSRLLAFPNPTHPHMNL